MLGTSALNQTWSRPTRPPAARPTTGQALGWSGASPGHRAAESDETQSSRLEALIHSFLLWQASSSTGLTGGAPEGRLLPFRPRSQTKSAAGSRSRELAWKDRHHDLLQTLAGRWVIVEGDELIAHGQDPAALVSAARRRGIQIPYVFFVEPLAQGVAKIGL